MGIFRVSGNKVGNTIFLDIFPFSTSGLNRSSGYHILSIRRQFIKSFIGVGAMRLLAIPLGLGTSIVLARFLGIDQFGQYSFVMALIPLLALPASGGLQNLLTREVAAFSQSNSWALYKGVLNSAHFWVIALSLLIVFSYLLLTFAGKVVPRDGDWGLVQIGLVMLPLIGLNAVRNGAIKGLGFPAIAELPSSLIQPMVALIGLSFTAFYLGLNATSAISIQVISYVVTFLIASTIFYKLQPKASEGVNPKYQLRAWGGSLAPFTLLAFVGAFNSQLGIVVLGLISTNDQVAALRVAERGAQFVTLSLTIVNVIISPHIVKAYKGGDIKFLQRLSRNSARAAFLVALPIGVVLLLFGDKLIGLLFGNEYAEAAYFPLIVLVIGQLFNSFMGSVGFLLAMTGNEKQSLKGQIMSVIVSLALCLILIPKHGAIGAAIAVSCGIVVWNLVLGYLVHSKVKIRPSAL